MRYWLLLACFLTFVPISVTKAESLHFSGPDTSSNCLFHYYSGKIMEAYVIYLSLSDDQKSIIADNQRTKAMFSRSNIILILELKENLTLDNASFYEYKLDKRLRDGIPAGLSHHHIRTFLSERWPSASYPNDESFEEWKVREGLTNAPPDLELSPEEFQKRTYQFLINTDFSRKSDISRLYKNIDSITINKSHLEYDNKLKFLRLFCRLTNYIEMHEEIEGQILVSTNFFEFNPQIIKNTYDQRSLQNGYKTNIFSWISYLHKTLPSQTSASGSFDLSPSPNGIYPRNSDSESKTNKVDEVCQAIYSNIDIYKNHNQKLRSIHRRICGQ